MKWLHDILKGASLTGALFVFQACYGSPQIEYLEGGAPMRFSLVSARTGEPLEGIGIAAKPLKEGIYQIIGTTGADGKCEVFIPFVRDLGKGLIFSSRTPTESMPPRTRPWQTSGKGTSSSN